MVPAEIEKWNCDGHYHVSSLTSCDGGPLSSEQRENNVAATAVSDTHHHHAAVEYCTSNQAL